MKQQSNDPTNKKETNATPATPLTPAQRQYVEAVYAHLCKSYGYKIAKANLRGHKPTDVANFAIQKVIRNVRGYMDRYPTADHAANAVAANAFVDYCRRDNAQRGHGARGSRTVIGDEPSLQGDRDGESLIARQSGTVLDPEDFVEDDYREESSERSAKTSRRWRGMASCSPKSMVSPRPRRRRCSVLAENT